MTVNGEFQVKLGISSDNASTPWRIYKIELFVRDPEEPGEEKTTRRGIHLESFPVSLSLSRTRASSSSTSKWTFFIRQRSVSSIFRSKYWRISSKIGFWPRRNLSLTSIDISVSESSHSIFFLDHLHSFNLDYYCQTLRLQILYEQVNMLDER